ncbi:LPS-assembly lipoprotein rlpB precursor [Vibrio ishigakensis]|uniref:LPS-assembly lipoprotein LptE n=1 Tax=Vibrio ishigakensis TaxID=1481914 RepID=A0A0B8NKJ6_9VIBR|nr:LPS assembly lipoprotein LptE [Vibrio ishigakensis]GAM54621.1 LPS-assembly lipoprotein rlpB precursor [Vibrio ishigakensis]
MTLIPRLRLLIAFVIVSLLSGCGFHFRGDYLVPDEVGKLSVTSFDEYAQLTRDVKRELRLNGIDITAPAASVSNLHLVSESISERTLSLYQNSRAAEKELTLRVSYRVVVPEQGMKTFNTQVNRSFLDNPLTALAKSVEREMIEDEMRKQASRQIIRQLARLRADVLDDKAEFDDEPVVNEDGVMLSPEEAAAQDDQISLQAEYEKNDPQQPQATPETQQSTDATDEKTSTDAEQMPETEQEQLAPESSDTAETQQ